MIDLCSWQCVSTLSKQDPSTLGTEGGILIHVLGLSSDTLLVPTMLMFNSSTGLVDSANVLSLQDRIV